MSGPPKPSEPSSSEAQEPTPARPRVAPVARRNLPRTGTDPRALAKLLERANGVAPEASALSEEVIVVEEEDMPQAAARPPAAPLSAPAPAHVANVPRVGPGAPAAVGRRAPRGLGAAPPPVALSAADALAAARAAESGRAEAPAGTASAAPPATPPAPVARAPLAAPSPRPAAAPLRGAPRGKAPRGMGAAPAPRVLTAEEALAAARRAEASRSAFPSALAVEARGVVERSGQTTRPRPRSLPTDGQALLAAVQGLVEGLLPETDAWVANAVGADPRKDPGIWRANRSKACIQGDLGHGLACATVILALEAVPCGVVYAHVATSSGERLLVVDVLEGRPLATLRDPHAWGVTWP
jgi:hypothetical protein